LTRWIVPVSDPADDAIENVPSNEGRVAGLPNVDRAAVPAAANVPGYGPEALPDTW
jgi:hypothetical protein